MTHRRRRILRDRWRILARSTKRGSFGGTRVRLATGAGDCEAGQSESAFLSSVQELFLICTLLSLVRSRAAETLSRHRGRPNETASSRASCHERLAHRRPTSNLFPRCRPSPILTRMTPQSPSNARYPGPAHRRTPSPAEKVGRTKDSKREGFTFRR